MYAKGEPRQDRHLVSSLHALIYRATSGPVMCKMGNWQSLAWYLLAGGAAAQGTSTAGAYGQCKHLCLLPSRRRESLD